MTDLYRKISFIYYILVSIGTLMYVSYHMWIPLTSADYSIILIYLLLLIIIHSSPLKIGDIYVMFTLAISLTVFLEYGIAVEAWLIQITMLVGMLISIRRRNMYRLVLTQMMFIWVSLTAGFSFLLAGGTIGFTVSMVREQLIPIGFYTLSFFISNHLILYFYLWVLEKRKIPFFSEDLFWDAATFLFTLPLGLIMYLVKITYGVIGMLFVSLLIIIVTQLFKLYSELVHSHQQLTALNNLSASFTSELNLDKTISALQQSIKELLTFDYSYIFLMDEDRLKLTSIGQVNGQVNKPDVDYQLELGEGLSGRVALYRKAQMIGSDAEIYELENELDCMKNNKSLLSVPMLWNNQTLGVITLGSSDSYYYSKKDMTIANILGSQAAIAIQNAKIYQKTEAKNLIDELTGIYNFRAFEEILHTMIAEAEMKKETVSLLMLDLDYFKKVNDQYGHLAGNKVLKNLANVLKEHTRKEDVIARYGGEEFVVIIPDTGYERATVIANRIRESVEQMKTIVKDTLNGEGETTIQVTVSIGVASFPDMANSDKELVRNADRAMYVGSKQTGRNRVAVYKEI